MSGAQLVETLAANPFRAQVRAYYSADEAEVMHELAKQIKLTDADRGKVAFKPTMREADDEVIRRSRVFVDTRGGAMAEAGDIVQPLASGVLTKDAIVADLFELTRGTRQGRRSREEVTLFKSVGAAIEDLTTAVLAYQGRI
jgi:Ornithine cyclodeaminase/mu-crystallin family/Proline utilization A proline dehydrogenase N-terminal domain